MHRLTRGLLAASLGLCLGACDGSKSAQAKASEGPSQDPSEAPGDGADADAAPSGATTAATGDAAPAATGRPAEDIARDARRKPQEVMDFFELEAGDRVVELMAGRGYYVELLADRVGPQGKVWAHNSPFVLERFAREPITERLARLANPAIARLDTPLDAPELPEDLDGVLIILFYHDTYWQEVDRKAMLAAIHASLADDGVFGLVDHHAQAGSRDRDVKRLHRVDREMVLEEVLAAGFVLDAESELLRHPEDDLERNVFFAGEDQRDLTDRFVMRFKKAQKPAREK